MRRSINSATLPIVFYIDHSATISIATSLRIVSSEKLNLRLVRVAIEIQRHNIKVFYRPRKTNRVADALSRLLSSDPT
jgi:hypothetical protein